MPEEATGVADRGMPPGPIINQPRQWTRRDWARYQAFKRRLYMRHRRLVDMYELYQDLYGHGWEITEEWFIREECEEIGLPMGYGRVGKGPQQISWGMLEPTVNVDWAAPEEAEEVPLVVQPPEPGRRRRRRSA